MIIISMLFSYSLNRCKLKNLVGVILSREVHVKAGKLLISLLPSLFSHLYVIIIVIIYNECISPMTLFTPRYLGLKQKKSCQRERDMIFKGRRWRK
jgi:hypothetical protein